MTLITCVRVIPPPVAVIVTLYVPLARVEAAVNVSLVLPLPGEAIVAGAKLAVSPLGKPLTDKPTAALNPFTAPLDSVTALDPPCATLALPALLLKVKLGATTVTDTFVVAVTPAPAPLNVTA